MSRHLRPTTHSQRRTLLPQKTSHLHPQTVVVPITAVECRKAEGTRIGVSLLHVDDTLQPMQKVVPFSKRNKHTFRKASLSLRLILTRFACFSASMRLSSSSTAFFLSACRISGNGMTSPLSLVPLPEEEDDGGASISLSANSITALSSLAAATSSSLFSACIRSGDGPAIFLSSETPEKI
jgi:hypothetical protein